MKTYNGRNWIVITAANIKSIKAGMTILHKPETTSGEEIEPKEFTVSEVQTILEWFVLNAFVAQDMMYTYTSPGLKKGFHEIIESKEWYLQSEV